MKMRLLLTFSFAVAGLILLTLLSPHSQRALTLQAASRSYDTGYIQLCTTNCGFEFGYLYSWLTRYGGVAVSTESPRSGWYAVKGSSKNNDHVTRSITFTSSLNSYIDAGTGRLYISSYVRPGSSESVRIRTWYYNSTGGFITGWATDWQGKTSGWKSMNTNSSIPRGTRNVWVVFEMQRTSGDFTDVDIDDVSITARFAQSSPPTPTFTQTRIPTATTLPTATAIVPTATVPPGTSTTKITGKITDATTKRAIANAYVCISIPSRCVYTNALGTYQISARSPSSQIVTVYHPNYIYVQEAITLTAAPTRPHHVGLVKPFSADKMKIVLNWDAQPADLDLTLFVEKPASTDNYSIYETVPGSCVAEPFACLQSTSSTGYGPELIQIAKIQPRWYQLAVRQYTTAGSLYRHAKPRVHVYRGAEIIQSYSIPVATTGCSGSGCMWYVFNFTGSDNTFTPFHMTKNESVTHKQ